MLVLAALALTAPLAFASSGCSQGGAGGSAGTGGHAGGEPDAGRDAAAMTTTGWHLTTYFSAVESFFTGAPAAVTGCLDVNCSSPGDPDSPLGSYPGDFVDTVQAEGTGKITSGAGAGRFLNWSASQPGSGFWLDDAPRDAQGNALVPYVSAAAHESYPYGAAFTVVDCGVDQTTAEPMDAKACADFQMGKWEVRDRFESNTEVKHLDLYIGLQTTADMNDDPHFVDQVNAATTLP
jgi:hypothetical protein